MKLHAFPFLLMCGQAACVPYSLPGFAPVARELDMSVRSDSCRFSPSELTRLELSDAAGRLHDRYRADWACDMLVDNILRDDTERTCFPSPNAVFGYSYTGVKRVEGRFSYMGVVALPYSYDLGGDPGGYPVVTIRISFAGFLTNDAGHVLHMQDTLNQAAAIWTRAAPRPSVRFRFLIVDPQERPHFSLELSEGCPRAPFNMSWGLGCPAHVLAHEAGHMLGLDDEYNQIRKTTGHIFGVDKAWDRDRRLKLEWFQCGPDSIMCDSRGEDASPQPFHYYIVLRRYFCPREQVLKAPPL